ncbi:MAG: 4Fe-4S ferredoxin, partial [Dehalococcoidia bacterium]|nr:4Fe-4S ferredoxin [Dehalococcoidia bacterium]
MAKAILYDATKCTACRACQVACKQWNELEAEETTNRGTYENPPDLSPQTWLKIKFMPEVKRNGKIDWLFTRQACMHCTDAS